MNATNDRATNGTESAVAAAEKLSQETLHKNGRATVRTILRRFHGEDFVLESVWAGGLYRMEGSGKEIRGLLLLRINSSSNPATNRAKQLTADLVEKAQAYADEQGLELYVGVYLDIDGKLYGGRLKGMKKRKKLAVRGSRSHYFSFSEMPEWSSSTLLP